MDSNKKELLEKLSTVETLTDDAKDELQNDLLDNLARNNISFNEVLAIGTLSRFYSFSVKQFKRNTSTLQIPC